MKKTIKFFALVAALVGTTLLAQSAAPACRAVVFVLQDLEKHPAVQSPDGNYRVVLSVRSEDDQEGSMVVYHGPRKIHSFVLHDLSGGVFVKWAPDTRAFYFMWSNGGMIGGYRVRVFRVVNGDVEEVPATAAAEQEFDRKHPCRERGHNVFAVRWYGSDRLLLALQVYPTGDCGKELGLYRGYDVNVGDGTITKRYSEKALMTAWPKGCPSDIYPTGLWSSDELKQAKEAERKNH